MIKHGITVLEWVGRARIMLEFHFRGKARISRRAHLRPVCASADSK
jgi:hypothetical protein